MKLLQVTACISLLGPIPNLSSYTSSFSFFRLVSYMEACQRYVQRKLGVWSQINPKIDRQSHHAQFLFCNES